LSLDGTVWNRVEVQDSTFSFSLSLGSDTTDIDFFVRAIDNDGGIDPTPAYLRVPIRNSSPVAKFDSVQAPPDTAFLSLTLFLNVVDQDGADNLDSIYLKANNGPWYPLPPYTSVVTLIAEDPSSSLPTTAKVFLGTNAVLQNLRLDGYHPGSDNVFFLKAKDIAGSESAIDTSSLVYVTRKSSDLLVIDANIGGSVPSPEQVLYPTLNSVAGNFDVIDLRSNGGANQPRFWTPTFELTLKAYDKVFWYGDASDDALTLLENAAGAIQSYLFADGKILFNTSFPSSYDNTSSVQEFLPLDSISTSLGSVRLPIDSLLSPVAGFATLYDTLETSIFVGRATPFYAKPSSEVMYEADLFTGGGWIGPNVVAARSTNLAGNTNVVLLSVQLHQINGRPAALEGFLQAVLTNEFNW